MEIKHSFRPRHLLPSIDVPSFMQMGEISENDAIDPSTFNRARVLTSSETKTIGNRTPPIQVSAIVWICIFNNFVRQSHGILAKRVQIASSLQVHGECSKFAFSLWMNFKLIFTDFKSYIGAIHKCAIYPFNGGGGGAVAEECGRVSGVNEVRSSGTR